MQRSADGLSSLNAPNRRFVASGPPLRFDDAQLVLVHHKSHSTLHYYFLERARLFGSPFDSIIDLSVPHSLARMNAILRARPYILVICRYFTSAALKLVRCHYGNFRGAVYFTDDDIDALLADPSVPFRYRTRLYWRYGRVRRDLQNLCGEVWTATASLAKRFEGSVNCLPPIPGNAFAEYQPGELYFYHGTGVHRREFSWLAEVVRRVQALRPNAVFEVLDDVASRRAFSGIPRLKFIPPASWSDYHARTLRLGGGVGLAPLLPSPANDARSATRFFDITRAGAAGVFSESKAYGSVVADGKSGRLLPNDTDAWVNAVCALLGDPQLQWQMNRAAVDTCIALRNSCSDLPIPSSVARRTGGLGSVPDAIDQFQEPDGGRASHQRSRDTGCDALESWN